MIKYNEFLLERYETLILESIEEYPFVLSVGLLDLFERIADDSANEMAKRIALLYIGLDETKNNSMSNMSYFNTSDDNQLINFITQKKAKEADDSWTVSHIYNNIKPSGSIKIGRLTRKVIELYNLKNGKSYNFTDSEIESFVNVYKAYYDHSNNKGSNFKIVKGDEIVYWYNEKNYENDSDGELGNSCMKYKSCEDYIKLYAENDSNSLLILTSPNNKLIGRALLWELKSGEDFMDRIYTKNPSDLELFEMWANENNYLHRYSSRVIASPDGTTYAKELTANFKKIDIKDRHKYEFPYMDTLKYFYWEEGVVRNYIADTGFYTVLEDTSGDKHCSCGGGEVECDICNDGCSKCKNGYTTCKKCGGFT